PERREFEKRELKPEFQTDIQQYEQPTSPQGRPLRRDPRTEPRERMEPRGEPRMDMRSEPREPPVRRMEMKPEQKELFTKTIEELVGTRAACIFDSENQVLGKVPVSELMDVLKTVDNPHAIVFDGKVDFRLNTLARRKGVKILIGMDKERFASPITILSRRDLQPASPPAEAARIEPKTEEKK
ncbi:MAG TPA: hypothetical protein VJ485_02980, partial [archaeon]|nr:hypothetical protein [archaeon]